MKEIITRTLTGIVFVAVLIAAITYNKYTVAGLFFIVSILGMYEFFILMEKGGFKPKKSVTITAGALIYAIIAYYSFGAIDFKYLLFIFPLLVLIVIIELFRKSDYPVSNFAFSIVGIIYIVIPFAILNFFAYYKTYSDIVGIDEKYSYFLLLAFFVIQWANDTGAYLSGKMLGKTKLFERISPNKTWEGAIGGAFLAVITGIIFSTITDSDIIHWVTISLLIVVFGTLGDLTESQIKRSIGVKDSGNLLPGHGGILDRFDGVLFSAPFVLAYLQLFNIQSLF